jgi:hypothetical protein
MVETCPSGHNGFLWSYGRVEAGLVLSTGHARMRIHALQTLQRVCVCSCCWLLLQHPAAGYDALHSGEGAQLCSSTRGSCSPRLLMQGQPEHGPPDKYFPAGAALQASPGNRGQQRRPSVRCLNGRGGPRGGRVHSATNEADAKLQMKQWHTWLGGAATPLRLARAAAAALSPGPAVPPPGHGFWTGGRRVAAKLWSSRECGRGLAWARHACWLPATPKWHLAPPLSLHA